MRSVTPFRLTRFIYGANVPIYAVSNSALLFVKQRSTKDGKRTVPVQKLYPLLFFLKFWGLTFFIFLVGTNYLRVFFTPLCKRNSSQCKRFRETGPWSGLSHL